MSNDARSRAQDEADVDAMIAANATAKTGGDATPPAGDTATGGDYVGQPGTPGEQTQPPPAPAAASQQPPQGQEPPQGQQQQQQPNPDAPVTEETYKAKFGSLRGKYDKEVPELHRQLREANDRIGLYQTEVSSLRTQLQQAQAGQNAPQPQGQAQEGGPPPTTNAALEKLRSEYGDELADGVQALISEATQQFQQPQGQAQQQQPQQQQGPTAFEMELSAELVPHRINYFRMNRDPRFLQWLDAYDGTDSPYKRHEQLNHAVQSGDTAAVAAFFVRYAKASGQIGAGPGDTPPGNPLQQHAQVQDGGAGAEPPPSQVSLEQAQAEYFAALDAVARGEMTEQECSEGPEKVYYSVLGQSRAQQDQAGATI